VLAKTSSGFWLKTVVTGVATEGEKLDTSPGSEVSSAQLVKKKVYSR
jgi:hypothetical protein